MSDGLVSFFLAAGVAGWTYSKMNQRLGYGNNKDLYVIVSVAFVLTFAAFFILVKYILHLNQ
jgi:hypothetical protein